MSGFEYDKDLDTFKSNVKLLDIMRYDRYARDLYGPTMKIVDISDPDKTGHCIVTWKRQK